MKTHTKVGITYILFIFFQTILTPSALRAEGNHTWAKSEAWTWMGHLNQVDTSGQWSLRDEGFAFIHYFTRNETGTGRMNFKSSAVTKTINGTGVSYDKKTTFPEANNKKFQLKVSENELNIEFIAPGQKDTVREAVVTSEDLSLLNTKILPLYPGLKIAPHWSVKKFDFSAFLGSSHRATLQFYGIWPDIAPPNQQMEFFGLKDSYTYSSPMLVAYGDWYENGKEARKVVGLCFLDRQWSKDYFGKNIFENPLDLFKKNHALKWAHNWSAFHARAPQTNDWYFVHLWQQVQRTDDQADQRANYTGVQWSKNGEQQAMLPSSHFEWVPTKFVLNQSNVLMNFAEGRSAYFPQKYAYVGTEDESYLEIEASPKLQSLDQPIYLYEGYAQGKGIWDHREVELRGRVESSQILFRDVDYTDMLKSIDLEDLEQAQLAGDLRSELNRKKTCSDYLEEQKSYNKFLFNDLLRKQQIFSAQFQSKPKRDSSSSMIYY